jgi:hypothetical protein
LGLFDIIERLTVRYGVVAMVGDVVIAVVWRKTWLES